MAEGCFDAAAIDRMYEAFLIFIDEKQGCIFFVLFAIKQNGEIKDGTA